jgi:hypothetical protein
MIVQVFLTEETGGFSLLISIQALGQLRLLGGIGWWLLKTLERSGIELSMEYQITALCMATSLVGSQHGFINNINP